MIDETEWNNPDVIVILDVGSQSKQPIARVIRDLGISSEVFPHTVPAEEIKKLKPKGLILSGGPDPVHFKDAITVDKKIFNLDIPILGICYGMHLLAGRFDGKIKRRSDQKCDHATIQIKDGGPELFKGLPEKMNVWMSFGDTVDEVPAGFVVDAESEQIPVAAISNTTRKLYGIQFQPEAAQTEHGKELLKNFVFGLCHCIES